MKLKTNNLLEALSNTEVNNLTAIVNETLDKNFKKQSPKVSQSQNYGIFSAGEKIYIPGNFIFKEKHCISSERLVYQYRTLFLKLIFINNRKTTVYVMA